MSSGFAKKTLLKIDMIFFSPFSMSDIPTDQQGPPADLNEGTCVHRPGGPIYRVSNFMILMKFMNIYNEGLSSLSSIF